jgi:O-succinylhomoserine sulfhydrylase
MEERRLETDCIRTPEERSHNRAHSMPVYMTSSFLFEDAEQGRALFAEEIEGNTYSRFSNPNTNDFIQKMCRLEGAEDGFAFASGMAAIFGSLCAHVSAGDHIVASRSIFGSSYQIFTKILPRFGVECSFADIDRPESFEESVKSNTKLIFIETPSNPGLDIIDLEYLHQIKKRHGLILFVDNTFATPCIQRPIEQGADLVMHSATKYIDGQGRAIGGVTVGSKELIKEVRFFTRQTGASMSPFNAWIFSKSLETLSVRMDRHSSNALALAELLSGNGELESVKYPFLPDHPAHELAKRQMSQGGGIVTFVVKGGYQRALRFLDGLEMITISANLGDTRTIATHPTSTTHSRLTEEERLRVGILPGLIRISAGLEHIDDIRGDILRAIDRSR